MSTVGPIEPWPEGEPKPIYCFCSGCKASYLESETTRIPACPYCGGAEIKKLGAKTQKPK